MGSTLEPLAVDVAEAARLAGLSRSKMYELIMAGAVKSAKVGARRLVPLASLRAWVDAQGSGGPP